MTHETPPGLHADVGNDHTDDPANDATDTQQVEMDTHGTDGTGDTHSTTVATNTLTLAGTVAPRAWAEEEASHTWHAQPWSRRSRPTTPPTEQRRHK